MIIPELKGKADVLLIIPPFAMTNYQSLGVHILQALAKREGYNVRVFYGNIHFASALGETYPKLCEAGPYMLGERCFAQAAWGKTEDSLYHNRIYDHKASFGWKQEAQFLFPSSENIPLDSMKETSCIAIQWVESLKESLKQLDCPLIGLSSSYEQINASVALIKAIKEIHQGTTTFMGGYSAEGIMAQGLVSLDPDSLFLDYIFSGESESSFIDFLRDFTKGITPEKRIIKGITLENMDDLPSLDYSEYFSQLENYLPKEFNNSSAQIALETSRGCWWGEKSHCLFCGYSDKRLKFREKSSPKFLKELEHMEKYGSSYAHMADLIMPKAHFDGLLPALVENGAPWTFYYEQRAAWDRDKLELMKKAGIMDNQPGIETLSTGLLRFMGKGSNLKRNLRFLRESTGAEIKMYWNIVWGFPGESAEEYETMTKMMPIISHLIPPVGIFKLALSRFSPLFEYPDKWGLKNLRPLPAYNEVFPSSADTEKLAYYFLCDYQAETFEKPHVMNALVKQVEKWNISWENPISRPRLMIARSGSGDLVLLDTRDLGFPLQTPINSEQTLVLLKETTYENTELQLWACSRRAAIETDGDFVPLVTINYSLKKELEHEYGTE